MLSFVPFANSILKSRPRSFRRGKGWLGWRCGALRLPIVPPLLVSAKRRRPLEYEFSLVPPFIIRYTHAEAHMEVRECRMPEETTGTHPLQVYYSYALQDEALHKELETHLSILQRQSLITGWHQRNISPGTERAPTIDQHLSTAHIILLLISPNFLASDFCYSLEMTQALARHDAGEARVIPILIRPVSWEGAPFSKLQILPREGIPVTSKQWESRDDAWLNVTKELRSVIAELKKTRQPQVTALSPRIWHVPIVATPSSPDEKICSSNYENGSPLMELRH
jgi:hypothetical protein